MKDEKKPAADLSARTKTFALRVIRLYSPLPKNTLALTLGKQVLRSGTSVGTNYREANRSRTKNEFIAILTTFSKRTKASNFHPPSFTLHNFLPDAQTQSP